MTNDDRKAAEFVEQLGKVRDTTRSLIHSVMFDIKPSPGASVDFGIDSQKHFESLYHPLRAGEIMPKELDEALGNGRKLTELAQGSPSNPHKDVEFHTSWDGIYGREAPPGAKTEEAKLADNLDRLLSPDEHPPTPAEFKALAQEQREDVAAAKARDADPIEKMRASALDRLREVATSRTKDRGIEI